jgi:stress-induced morphogen
MEVLSYARQDWFEQQQSEDDLLRRRLHEAQLAAQRAHEARVEAESRLQLVERERDVYRLLAQRWQRRLHAATNERTEARGTGGGGDGDEDLFAGIDDVAAAALFGANDPLILRLGPIVRRFHRNDNEDAEEERAAEGDSDVEEDQVDMDEASDSSSVEEETMQDESMDEATAESPAPAHSMSVVYVRPQIRTVSISSESI